MKRKLLCLLLIICSVFNIVDVNASTKTYERTNEDLRVGKGIEITDKNRSNVITTPSVDASEKIYDFAELFTDEEEKDLYDKVTAYIDHTKLDLAIVTISYNPKHSAMTYADDFYDYNDFGVGMDNNSGVLFLIDMDTREIWISTTGNAITEYSGNKIDEIVDNTYGYMSGEEYYKGADFFLTAVSNYFGVPNKGYVIDKNGEIVKDSSRIVNGIFASLAFSIIATAIIMYIMYSMNKMVFKATNSRHFLNNSTKDVKLVSDRFISTHTSRVKIESSSSSGGGTHSGSSGVSHGGGGHRF